MGGSSAAAPGMALAPTGGGCWASARRGARTEGRVRAGPRPGTACSSQRHLPDCAVAPATGDNCCSAVPRKEGTGGSGRQDPQHWGAAELCPGDGAARAGRRGDIGAGTGPQDAVFSLAGARQLVYLPPPWGDCKATPIESDFFTNYSLTACRLDCETRYLAENCNCRMVHMPGNANVCTPEQYKECADPALDFLVTKDSEYCACRTPCAMVRYGKELSMVKIPSKASAKYLAKKFNKTEQYIADNVLVLDIFFEALNYEMIEQKKAYEVAGLLGDIGGQMGLFIGASLLTILEIFDYLYEVFRDKLLSLYKEKKRSPRSDGGTLEHPAVPGSPAAPRPPRAPGPPCPAPRPVSASPRTCYLVTRL